MLTNDQCIEIAKRIWGWREEIFDEAPEIKYLQRQNENGQWQTVCQIHEVKEIVNSWNGFGRTLEAMASERMGKWTLRVGWPSTGFDCGDDNCSKQEHLFFNDEIWEAGERHTESFIEATQLAALEALKSNTE